VSGNLRRKPGRVFSKQEGGQERVSSWVLGDPVGLGGLLGWPNRASCPPRPLLAQKMPFPASCPLSEGRTRAGESGVGANGAGEPRGKGRHGEIIGGEGRGRKRGGGAGRRRMQDGGGDEGHMPMFTKHVPTRAAFEELLATVSKPRDAARAPFPRWELQLNSG
jgi:hypothetical protein